MTILLFLYLYEDTAEAKTAAAARKAVDVNLHSSLICPAAAAVTTTRIGTSDSDKHVVPNELVHVHVISRKLLWQGQIGSWDGCDTRKTGCAC